MKPISTLPTVALLVFSPLWAIAQSAAARARPGFEVAAIRRCEEDGRRRRGETSSAERLLVSCGTLELLIRQAYGQYADGHPNASSSVRLEGGPGWINGLRLRPVEEGACTAPDPINPAYVRDGAGAAAQLPAAGHRPRCRGDLTLERKLEDAGATFLLRGEEVSIGELCAFLSLVLDRPVTNKPSIGGRFSFRLEFSASEATPKLLRSAGGQGGITATSFDPTAPSIFRATEDQLGLKIEPSKGFGEVLVIDSVQRPSKN